MYVNDTIFHIFYDKITLETSIHKPPKMFFPGDFFKAVNLLISPHSTDDIEMGIKQS